MKPYENNNMGIPIKKCCASCEHKRFDNKNRICLLGEGMVPPSYVCKRWRMSSNLLNVGKGDGRIKKREYLMYALNRLMEEDVSAEDAATAKQMYRKATLGEIRSEFMGRQETIFDTIE